MFLVGTALHEAIRELVSAPNARCAVAFWGEGAQTKLLPSGQSARIICNLALGGTNPRVVRTLQAYTSIRHHDRLHAKVYLNDKEAIVASANASANGLGFEGTEQNSWIEAGVRTADTKAISTWFEELWNNANDVKQEDLAKASLAWRRRQRNRPTICSFADYYPPTSFPLVAWYGDHDWVSVPEMVKAQLGSYSKVIEDRIDRGIEVEDEADVPLLTARPWVLCFKLTRNGQRDKRQRLWWVSLGPMVRNGFRYTSEPHRLRDIVLAAEDSPPPPFNANEPKFERAFTDVIERPEFSSLRASDYEGAWFAPRHKHMERFWIELRSHYRSM